MQSTFHRNKHILFLGIAITVGICQNSCSNKEITGATTESSEGPIQLESKPDKMNKETVSPLKPNKVREVAVVEDAKALKKEEILEQKTPINESPREIQREVEIVESNNELPMIGGEADISTSIQIESGKGKKHKSLLKTKSAPAGRDIDLNRPTRYTPIQQEINTMDDEEVELEEDHDDGIAGQANGLDRNVPDVATLYERYNPFNENDWIEADEEATSTFSIDVDNASYTNFRRYVGQNQLPPKDAIRMEEWLNYFNYDLEGPKEGSEHPLNISSEIGACPWQIEDELVMIKMQAATAKEEDLPPSNLVFLVDVSGSMNRPNKLPLVQESMLKLVKKLRPEDHLSIVTYAGTSKKLLAPTSGDQKAKIEKAINSMTSGGGTAGSKGIEMAYQLCSDNFNENGNNRVILATDGDWNVGITNQDELKALIEKKRESGIFLSVLGFGMGNLNDAMMETIADNGNGNYAYVDNEKEAERLFNYEFSGTMHVIAKDVKLQVVFDEESVESYRLLGYENRVLENWMFNDDKIDAGDLGIGQNVVAFYQVKRKKASRGVLGKVDFRYKPLGTDQSTLLHHELTSASKNLSSDFQFASCVAEFALCLRESEHRGTGTMEAAILRGQKNLGNPNSGLSYEKRVEFVGLLDPTAEMWEDYVLEDAPDLTEKETELKLYPNPAQDHTIVVVPESIAEKWSVQIYDMKGTLIRVEHFNQLKEGRMDVSQLTRGTYILKVYNAGNSYGYLRLVKS